MAERDPEYEPITVPDDLLAKSLTQRMETPESYLFDPADFFDLDRDDFYYCRCGGCEECDELDYFFEFMYELQEDYDNLFEDPDPQSLTGVGNIQSPAKSDQQIPSPSGRGLG